jgi:hypothetical protein
MEEGKSNFIWFGSSYKGVHSSTVDFGNLKGLAVWVSIFDYGLLKGKLYLRKVLQPKSTKLKLLKAKGRSCKRLSLRSLSVLRWRGDNKL